MNVKDILAEGEQILYQGQQHRSRFQGEIHIKAIGKNDAPQLERIVSQKVTEYGFGSAWSQARYQQDRMNDYRRNESEKEESKDKGKDKGFWSRGKK
jgi:hypothetical protein